MAGEAQSPAPAAPARPRPKREREEEVLVWPDLVFIEFIAAALFTITFTILTVFINAPLLNRANLNVTPNPSKAPWYFLNLQELLLHMDKAWAGVLIPTIALIFFAAIPYMERSQEAQGVWFGTKYSGRMTVFTAAYATVVTWILVLFDAGKFGRITRWFPGLTPVEEQRQAEVSPGVSEPQRGPGHRRPGAARLGEAPPRRLHRNVYGGDGRLPGPVGNRELLPRPGTGPHP